METRTWAWLAGMMLLAPGWNAVGCSAGGADTSSASGDGGAGAGADTTSVANGGSGGDGSCASDTFPGSLAPVDLYVMLDQSSSMNDSGKWSAVTNALTTFMAAPESNGVGMGIQYFPIPPTGSIPSSCGGDADCGFYGPCVFGNCNGVFAPNDSCDPADYSDAEVAIAALPGVQSAIEQSLSSHGPSGDSTPTQPGYQGAVNYATAWATANPTHLTFIVLATDGEPNNCNPNSTQGTAGVAAAAATGSPPVRTFVIGVGDNLSSLNQIAAAGGTGQAFLVDAGNNTTQAFIDALVAIRAEGECQFQIPLPTDGSQPDFNRVNVTLQGPGGEEIELFNVGDASGCDPTDGGWYYDDPAAPNTIVLCPASCDQVRETDWDVEVKLGCATILK